MSHAKSPPHPASAGQTAGVGVRGANPGAAFSLVDGLSKDECGCLVRQLCVVNEVIRELVEREQLAPEVAVEICFHLSAGINTLIPGYFETVHAIVRKEGVS